MVWIAQFAFGYCVTRALLNSESYLRFIEDNIEVVLTLLFGYFLVRGTFFIATGF